MQAGIRIYLRERRDRPGSWEVTVRDGAGGRRRKQFGNEAEARAFAAEVKRVAATGGQLVEEQTVEAMVRGYLASVASTDVRPRTVEHREEMLRAVLRAFGGQAPVSEIATDEAVQGFKERRAKQIGQATQRHEMWALRQALRWAHSRGWIQSVPEIVLPKMPPPRQEWLRGNEITPFFDACSVAFRPLAEAAIYFGLREGEVCVAQAGDFDLSADVLWVREKPELDWLPKSKRARGIPLVGQGKRIGEEIATRPAHGWAWPSTRGERRRAGTWFSKATKRAAAGAGITRDLVFHDLRRTFGAMMIEAGAPMRAVQQALGHASIQTTERVYAPITTQFVAEAMTKMDAHLAVREAEYRASKPQPPPRAVLAVVK
ncbi:tyrosine-type recombinase/integrase [Myxococcota bacterium]